MISLNYRDTRPIYEQVRDGIRQLILTGAIATDEKLPSVREMATELSINPNTIQRAYRELEREGVIYSVPGRGSFAGMGETVRMAHVKELYAQLQSAINDLLTAGETQETILNYVSENINVPS